MDTALSGMMQARMCEKIPVKSRIVYTHLAQPCECQSVCAARSNVLEHGGGQDRGQHVLWKWVCVCVCGGGVCVCVGLGEACVKEKARGQV